MPDSAISKTSTQDSLTLPERPRELVGIEK
jgi:hypothetical protein